MDIYTLLSRVEGIVKNLNLGEYTSAYVEDEPNSRTDRYGFQKQERRKTYLKQKQLVGGVEGGNCWRPGDNTYFTISEPVQEFVALRQVILDLDPDIKLVDYLQVSGSMLLIDEEEERGYYGNYNTYHVFKVDLEKLLEWVNKLENNPADVPRL